MSRLNSWRSFQIMGLKPDVPDAALLSIFGSFGRVMHLENPGNGVAFVGFFKGTDAQNAFDALNNTLVFGEFINLTWITDDAGDPISSFLIENLSSDIDDNGLKTLFQPFGKILSCHVDRDDQGHSLRTGQVHYKECKVSEVLDNLNDVEVNNYNMRVAFLEPPTEVSDLFKTAQSGPYLFIDNIKLDVASFQIRRVFDLFENVKDVYVLRRGQHQYAYIFYKDVNAMESSVKLMAKRINNYQCSDVHLVNTFTIPKPCDNLHAVPLVARGVFAPEANVSWELTWQVYVIPSFDLTSSWNMYQICSE